MLEQSEHYLSQWEPDMSEKTPELAHGKNENSRFPDVNPFQILVRVRLFAFLPSDTQRKDDRSVSQFV
jgi:hypothetical protein